MNSQQLLYLNIFFGTLIVLYFVFGRSKPKQPARLKMKEDVTKDITAGIVLNKDEAEVITFAARAPEVIEPVKTEIVTEVIPIQSRNLKVYFAFNGHDWEAYEALGVPVNAPMTTVTKMYQHLIKTSDASTFDFYESAHQAILQRRKSRSP